MGQGRKHRELTFEEQQLFNSVLANPAYTKRAQQLFKDALERFALRNGPMEVIEPFDIFERDNWHCKRCNKYTPRELRDTPKPRFVPTNNAMPTLDHILSIGKGGCHTRSNVQLLCHQCNHEKQDRHKNELPPPITNFGAKLLAALQK